MPRKRIPSPSRRSASGRPQHTDPPRLWEISLPSSLCTHIEALLRDPLTGRTRYGARSQLIERLLREWAARSASAPLPAPTAPLPAPVPEEPIDIWPLFTDHPPIDAPSLPETPPHDT